MKLTSCSVLCSAPCLLPSFKLGSRCGDGIPDVPHAGPRWASPEVQWLSLPSSARAEGSIPGQGTKIARASRPNCLPSPAPAKT